MGETKVCAKCGQLLDLSCFSKDKSKRDGHVTVCKSCRKAYASAYYKEHAEEICEHTRRNYRQNKEQKCAYQKNWREAHPDYMRSYHAAHPQDKEMRRARYLLTDKAENARRGREYNRAHKEEISARRRERYATDPEYRARALGYRHKRRSRMRDLPNTLTPTEWNDALLFFGNRCAYCGTETVLEQDHVIPLTGGGGYTANNIVPACKSCNSSKGAKELETWFPQQTFYTEQAMSLINKWMAQN